MRGWSPEFRFKWRLSREDLVNTGFDMKFLAEGLSEPDVDAAGLHINVLEFIAIIMGLWLIIVLSWRCLAPVGSHIFAVFADNTSALSWLRYASCSHCANVHSLAHFTLALLFASGFQGKVQGHHLASHLNQGANALSHCITYPTWACLMAQCSQLLTCITYRLPCKLLSLLASMSSGAQTGEVSVAQMTRLLLNLVPNTRRVGSSRIATTTSLLQPSRLSRHSH
jgi:hypothetical protein